DVRFKYLLVHAMIATAKAARREAPALRPNDVSRRGGPRAQASVLEVILDGRDDPHLLDVGRVLVQVLDGEVALARGADFAHPAARVLRELHRRLARLL